MIEANICDYGFLAFLIAARFAHDMSSENAPNVKINFSENDFPIDDLDSGFWKKASVLAIDKYWSGELAPLGRHFVAKLLWSETAFYVRFDANRSEALVVSTKPNLKSKTPGLWDRDVCEIFIAPDGNVPQKYFEFEIAPSGEWLDLSIEHLAGKREIDWEYVSGMESAARIENEKITMAVKVGWKAFGRTPKAGDMWLGNLFRCVGKGPERGYLAWQPTMTKTPDFHVPERFGRFEFVK